MTAREQILSAARAALADRPVVAGPEPLPASARSSAAERLALLRERIEDYRATVRTVGTDGVASAVAEVLAEHGARRVVAPVGLPEPWRPRGALIAADATPAELDAVDAVVTGAALAIAETGTLVLDAGPDQGPRRLTLLPDLHVCIVRAGQVVDDVPAAMAALRATRRPITFISGPSATSDIELERVEGVHGPRRLEVIVVP